MKVLALDDEKGALKVLVRTLSMVVPDAEIYDFEEPEAALEWYSENKADVAFLDIQMPEVTGPELAARFKEINPDVRIVFVTGFLEDDSEEASAIADGFVMKPVTRRDISKVLGI